RRRVFYGGHRGAIAGKFPALSRWSERYEWNDSRETEGPGCACPPGGCARPEHRGEPFVSGAEGYRFEPYRAYQLTGIGVSYSHSTATRGFAPSAWSDDAVNPPAGERA